jgi:type II secretory pathway pseudopilin PulG
MTSNRISSNDGGYSLVECLVAGGLLAGVLLSITGLFAVGSNSVKSGRELTKATALANAAMEQVLAWPYDKVYGFAGAVPADQTKDWDTTMANAAYVGTPDDVADWAATANGWRDDVRTQLAQGVLRYRVEGIARLPTNLDPGLTSFLNAEFVRVTVTVEWTEKGRRRREVAFQELVL